MPVRALLIVNPYSGKKNGENIASYISERLKDNGYSCEIFTSHSLDELSQFISRADLASYALAGIIGGDGTMHEFRNAVFRKAGELPIPVALFPCGTGNAFNFDIGCSTVDETLECIYKNSISRIDIAEVSYGEWQALVVQYPGVRACGRDQCAGRKNAFPRGKPLYRGFTDQTAGQPGERAGGKNRPGRIAGEIFIHAGLQHALYRQRHDDGPPDRTGRRKNGKFDVLSISRPQKKLVTNIDGEIKGTTPLHFTVHTNKIRAFVAPR